MFTITVDWIAFAFILAALYTVLTYLISWAISVMWGKMTFGFQGGGAPRVSPGVAFEAYLLCLPSSFIMSTLMQFAHWHWALALLTSFIAIFIVGAIYAKIKQTLRPNY